MSGYDLTDPRVRNAVLVSMLGEEGVRELVRAQKIPAPPMALATAPAFDAGLDRVISAEVAADFVAKVAGKRVGPAEVEAVVGGLVGASADGYATWRVGRYADRELLPSGGGRPSSRSGRRGSPAEAHGRWRQRYVGRRTDRSSCRWVSSSSRCGGRGRAAGGRCGAGAP
jgi:hypothetical protein